MPWTAKDAPSTVRGVKQRRQWARIANAALRRYGDEGRAKRIASGTMKRQRRRKQARKGGRNGGR